MQFLLKLFYPAKCLTCDELIEDARGLCPKCWAATPFIVDPPCEKCGTPLLGDAEAGDLCEDCFQTPRPWTNGRAAMTYGGNGRTLVLRLKHADRTDLAHAAGGWMAQVSREIIEEDTVLAPVPLHWRRIVQRRYNQSALLAGRMAKLLDRDHVPDLLRRPTATRTLDGMGAADRFQTVAGAIVINRKRANAIQGRHVMIVDDVMTSGATLGQCAQACVQAGASHVSVATLARVARGD